MDARALKEFQNTDVPRLIVRGACSHKVEDLAKDRSSIDADERLLHGVQPREIVVVEHVDLVERLSDPRRVVTIAKEIRPASDDRFRVQERKGGKSSRLG